MNRLLEARRNLHLDIIYYSLYGILVPPFRRIVSPLMYAHSMIHLTVCAKSCGLPNLHGVSLHLPRATKRSTDLFGKTSSLRRLSLTLGFILSVIGLSNMLGAIATTLNISMMVSSRLVKTVRILAVCRSLLDLLPWAASWRPRRPCSRNKMFVPVVPHTSPVYRQMRVI